MRGFANVFSVILLSWAVAGAPLQFIKVQTLKDAVEAGEVSYVDAQFDPDRVAEFLEDFGDGEYDESDYEEIEYDEDFFEDDFDEETLESNRVYHEMFGKVFRIVPPDDEE